MSRLPNIKTIPDLTAVTASSDRTPAASAFLFWEGKPFILVVDYFPVMSHWLFCEKVRMHPRSYWKTQRNLRQTRRPRQAGVISGNGTQYFVNNFQEFLCRTACVTQLFTGTM